MFRAFRGSFWFRKLGQANKIRELLKQKKCSYYRKHGPSRRANAVRRLPYKAGVCYPCSLSRTMMIRGCMKLR